MDIGIFSQKYSQLFIVLFVTYDVRRGTTESGIFLVTLKERKKYRFEEKKKVLVLKSKNQQLFNNTNQNYKINYKAPPGQRNSADKTNDFVTILQKYVHKRMEYKKVLDIQLDKRQNLGKKQHHLFAHLERGKGILHALENPLVSHDECRNKYASEDPRIYI